MSTSEARVSALAQLNVGNSANPTDAVTSFINSALNASGLPVHKAKAASVSPYPGLNCTQTCARYCKVRRSASSTTLFQASGSAHVTERVCEQPPYGTGVGCSMHAFRALRRCCCRARPLLLSCIQPLGLVP